MANDRAIDQAEAQEKSVRLDVPFSSLAKLKEWRELMNRFMATVDFHCQAPAVASPYIEQQARLLHLRTEATKINNALHRADT